MAKLLPRHPVYVISKGRWEHPLTARILARDGVPFRVVVEPPERDRYAAAVGAERLAVLPFHDLGQGSIPARNWVWSDALAIGARRHWILDDNIRDVYRYYRGERVRAPCGAALALMEAFVERYANVAIAGPNYRFFHVGPKPPFNLNHHVYSCLLIDNALPYRWRGRYNEDTDLCLQVLAGGLCTILFNAFLIEKATTMSMKGGNTTTLYRGDGRLKMARSLERMWPGVVTVDRRWNRPQHVVAHTWKRFDTPLIPAAPRARAGDVGASDEHGMTLRQLRPFDSARLRRVLDGATERRNDDDDGNA